MISPSTHRFGNIATGKSKSNFPGLLCREVSGSHALIDVNYQISTTFSFGRKRFETEKWKHSLVYFPN